MKQISPRPSRTSHANVLHLVDHLSAKQFPMRIPFVVTVTGQALFVLAVHRFAVVGHLHQTG